MLTMAESSTSQGGDSDQNSSPKILLSTPWLKVGKNPWTEQAYESLKKEIATHQLLKKAKIGYFNVLLVGQISAGKSSFFNTVETVFNDHVTMKANAGAIDKSLTTQYRTYKVRARDNNNKPIKFKFCDSMGLEGGDAGLKATDVAKILDGHINDQAELSSGGIRPGDIGYNPSPGVGDQIHCVAFVVDASAMNYMDDKIMDKFKEIREEANHRCLNPIVILTRIDQVCDKTAADITRVYNSQEIKEIVQDVGKKFGITENMVYPVQNYSSEIEKEMGIDILTLRTLRQILRCSQDFLQDKVDRDKERLKQARRSAQELENRYGGRLKRKETVEDSEDSDDSDAKGDSDASSGKEKYASCPSEEEKGADEREANIELKSKQKIGVKASIKPPPVPPPLALDLGNSRSGCALYDFKAEDPDQVYLKRGDKIQELQPDVGGWTRVQMSDGKQGLVPSSYIVWKAQVAQVALVAPSVRTPPPPPIQKSCVAQHSYSSTHPDQLEMKIGEQFTMLQENMGDGWTLVKNDMGKEGKVPASYLKMASDEPSSQAPALPPMQAPAQPPMQAPTPQAPPKPELFCTALFEFKATHPTQLSMVVGEPLTMLEEQMDGGWTKVQNNSQNQGMVPTSFLEKAPQPSQAPAPPPSQAPAPPPNKAPSQPPMQAPAQPPMQAQAPPLIQAPAPPPIQAQALPPMQAPVPPPMQTQTPQAPTKQQLFCTALFEFKATHPTHLSMVMGEPLTVLQEQMDGGWTKVQNNSLNQGMVPTSFLEKAPPPMQAQAPPLMEAPAPPPIQAQAQPPMQAPAPPPMQAQTPQAPTKPQLFCTALFEFRATHPTHLSMVVGEPLTVLEEQMYGGWTKVQNNSQNQGMVPTSFLEKALPPNQAPAQPPTQAPPPPPMQAPTPQAPPKPELFCTALFEFKATHPTHLSMVMGEPLTVLEEQMDGGWTKVQNNLQNQGMVPTSFLEKGKPLATPAPSPQNTPQAPQQPPAYSQEPPPPSHGKRDQAQPHLKPSHPTITSSSPSASAPASLQDNMAGQIRKGLKSLKKTKKSKIKEQDKSLTATLSDAMAKMRTSVGSDENDAKGNNDDDDWDESSDI